MDNKILIVIDVQNGFITSVEHDKRAMQIAKLAKSGNFNKIIATRFINYTGSMYEKCFKWYDLKTIESIDLYAPLKDIVTTVFNKITYNPVNNNFIDALMQLNNGKRPKKVYLCGLDTDACVLATTIGLFEHNIIPVVLENYCFSTGGEQDLSWCCNYGSSDCPLINKNAKCEGGKDLVFSPWHPNGLDLGINHTTDYRRTQS